MINVTVGELDLTQYIFTYPAISSDVVANITEDKTIVIIDQNTDMYEILTYLVGSEITVHDGVSGYTGTVSKVEKASGKTTIYVATLLSTKMGQTADISLFSTTPESIYNAIFGTSFKEVSMAGMNIYADESSGLTNREIVTSVQDMTGVYVYEEDNEIKIFRPPISVPDISDTITLYTSNMPTSDTTKIYDSYSIKYLGDGDVPLLSDGDEKKTISADETSNIQFGTEEVAKYYGDNVMACQLPCYSMAISTDNNYVTVGAFVNFKLDNQQLKGRVKSVSKLDKKLTIKVAKYE